METILNNELQEARSFLDYDAELTDFELEEVSGGLLEDWTYLRSTGQEEWDKGWV